MEKTKSHEIMGRDKLISIVVPCFNEQETVSIFNRETSLILRTIEGYDYEILFIDDGSSDSTLDVLREVSQGDPHVKFISFSRNFGKEAAIYAGLNNARGSLVTIMDADLQDPPYLLPQMVHILEIGDYDSVATRRTDRKGEAKFKSFLSKKFYSIINSVSEVEIVESARDYRLMKRKMVDAVLSMSEYNRFTKGIFSWVGFKTYWLSYENVERVSGETSWSTFGLIKYAINGIINFSEAPLKIATWIGIVSSIMAAISLIFIVVRYLAFGDPVDGWASQACITIFIGGIQLLCIGILGEYLSKIYSETKRRPHYIVAESSCEKL